MEKVTEISRLWVFMAAGEWSHHQEYKIMENLAKEYAAQYPDRPLIIEVWEHGGWFQTYWFDKDTPNGFRLVTANDAAPLSEKTKEIIEACRGAESKHLGTVRRY